MSKRPMPTASTIIMGLLNETITLDTALVLAHRCADGKSLEETATAMWTNRRTIREMEVAGMRALGF